MSTPVVAAALDDLRTRGERVTRARTAVLEVLADASGHLDADDIVASAERRAPGVHRATIYRALATLEELGLVVHSRLGQAAAVYHLTEAHGHVHARCLRCGVVLDVPSAVLQPVADQLARDLGFDLDVEHAGLLGTCADCRSLRET